MRDSHFLLLFFAVFGTSGLETGFAPMEVLGFALEFSGGIVGGLLFMQPRVSASAFFTALVPVLSGAVSLMEPGYWLFAPSGIFGVEAVISSVVKPGRPVSNPV